MGPGGLTSLLAPKIKSGAWKQSGLGGAVPKSPQDAFQTLPLGDDERPTGVTSPSSSSPKALKPPVSHCFCVSYLLGGGGELMIYCQITLASP